MEMKVGCTKRKKRNTLNCTDAINPSPILYLQIADDTVVWANENLTITNVQSA